MEAQGSIIVNNMKISTSSGTIYWQEDEPLTAVDGDTWFKVVNGSATNVYNREGGAWVEVEFASQIIAEELVGKIITAAEINGGEINGTTITGAEFINNFNVADGELLTRKGNMTLRNGDFTQDNTVTRNVDGTKRYESHYLVRGGQMTANNTTYADDGNTITSTSLATLQGGSLNLTLTDSSGSYYGTLNAKALTKTPWITIKLGPDFAVAENNPPQYKVSYNLDGSRHVAFRGQFKLATGTMKVGTPYCPFRIEAGVGWTHTTTLPQSIAPEVPAFAALTIEPVSGGAIPGRMGLSADARMGFLPGTESKHVNLQGFSYDLD